MIFPSFHLFKHFKATVCRWICVYCGERTAVVPRGEEKKKKISGKLDSDVTSSEKGTWSRSSDDQWGDASFVVSVCTQMRIISSHCDTWTEILGAWITLSTDTGVHKPAPLTVTAHSSTFDIRFEVLAFRQTDKYTHVHMIYFINLPWAVYGYFFRNHVTGNIHDLWTFYQVVTP